MTWRLNYGNGTVNYHASRASAERELAGLTQYRPYAYIQRYIGDGEWERVR